MSEKCRINWNSKQVCSNFYNILEDELDKIKINNIFNQENEFETKNKINLIYNDILSFFRNANNAIIQSPILVVKRTRKNENGD